MADSTATTKHIGDLIVTKKNAASVAYITEVTGDLYIRADDHFAREQAMRERDYERRRAAHPDPSDPEHPDELDMTADVQRRIAWERSVEQQARIRRDTADREDAELLRWLLDQDPDFIGLRDGGGIDCANHPCGARAALIDARRDQQQGEHP